MRSVIATLSLALIAVTPALAHGPAEWIKDGRYKNGLGELCCGERDCGEKVSGTIEAKADGYHVDAQFRVTPPNSEPFLITVKETIPYHQAQPSPDGIFWVCVWGGERKCFFAPPPGS